MSLRFLPAIARFADTDRHAAGLSCRRCLRAWLLRRHPRLLFCLTSCGSRVCATWACPRRIVCGACGCSRADGRRARSVRSFLALGDRLERLLRAVRFDRDSIPSGTLLNGLVDSVGLCAVSTLSRRVGSGRGSWALHDAGEWTLPQKSTRFQGRRRRWFRFVRRLRPTFCRMAVLANIVGGSVCCCFFFVVVDRTHAVCGCEPSSRCGGAVWLLFWRRLTRRRLFKRARWTAGVVCRGHCDRFQSIDGTRTSRGVTAARAVLILHWRRHRGPVVRVLSQVLAAVDAPSVVVVAGLLVAALLLSRPAGLGLHGFYWALYLDWACRRVIGR